MRRRTLQPVKEEQYKLNTVQTFSERKWTVYTLVSSVGVICYLNSLKGDFVHDDIPAIVTNPDVTGEGDLVNVFRNDFWGTPMSDPGSHKSYRPLTTLSFRLNYQLFGMSAWWWHICNVLCHCCSCCLLVRVGAEVAKLRMPFAALAGLLFAVHPVHTEAVAGVVGRADVLACIFYLSSLLHYNGSSSKQRIWRSVALAGTSMLAKETGLTVLLFNICFDVYKSWNSHSRSPSKCRWKWEGLPRRLTLLACSLLLLAGCRLVLLHGSLPAFSPQDNPAAFHPSFAVRSMTFWYLAAMNWWLLLCPLTLSHDWQMGSVPLVTTILDPRNLFTVVMVALLVVLCYNCVLDFEHHRRTPAVVGLLLLVLPYLPASNLLVTVGFVIAERVLYIPSVGAALLTAYGIQLLWRCKHHRRWVTGAVVILASSGVVRTYLRNRDWRTKETLLRADLAVLPHNAKLHYNFGNFLKDIEQQDSAIRHYKEALRLWPSYASAHNNLGTLVVASGMAEHHFLQALHYNRYHVNAHYNLGKLYRKKNLISEAQSMLKRCIQLSPRFVQAHQELLLLTPDEEKQVILQKLLDLEPRNWEHYLIYGNWVKKKGWKQSSLKFYFQAVRWSIGSTKEGTRGDHIALRTTCSVLRDLGQYARIIQLIARWRAASAGSGTRTDVEMTGVGESRVSAGGVALLAERASRVREELTRRARRYDTSLADLYTTKPLDLQSNNLYIETNNKLNFKAIYKDEKTHNLISAYIPNDKKLIEKYTTKDKIVNLVTECQNACKYCNLNPKEHINSRNKYCNNAVVNINNNKIDKDVVKKSCDLKRKILNTQFKLHNKSETGHKGRIDSVGVKDENLKRKIYTPYITDIIHTL